MVRVNQYVAQATGLSRRAADAAIQEKRVKINGVVARVGQSVMTDDKVTLDSQPIIPAAQITLAFNKPAGYVCSRQGQGGKTIYELLPAEYHHLKPVGRLDKDSSGLLLLTNDGQLAQQLSHPSGGKIKIYQVVLDKTLSPSHQANIEQGIKLEDGLSKLKLNGHGRNWAVTMHEGRNRQIRRTFAALGYETVKLHRTQFGSYQLESLPAGACVLISRT